VTRSSEAPPADESAGSVPPSAAASADDRSGDSFASPASAAGGEAAADDAPGGAARTPCFDDAELLAFVEQSLPAERQAALLAHVDECTACRELVAHLAATEPDAPAELGRYRLEHEIGSGGMGVVWRAWDPLFERAVAIKRVRPELGDELGRARALREARALARLQHPNVIAAYDVGIAGEDVYLATELIEEIGRAHV
jgi:hypothetical protein